MRFNELTAVRNELTVILLWISLIRATEFGAERAVLYII